MNAPPLLVSFRSLEELQHASSEFLPLSEWKELTALHARGLPPVTSSYSISLLFGFSPRFIGAMAKMPSRYYRRFSLGKKSGGSREIFSPKVSLKVIQKWLGSHLSHACKLPDHVHGFVPGRSTVTAASVHCPADWVVLVDIESFFQSVSKEQTFTVLLDQGYSRAAAHLIADLVTLNNGLPQGAPSSPVLANLAFRATDDLLGKLASAEGCRVTRYADDIAFSGTGKPPESILDDLIAVIEAGGWRIASAKTKTLLRPKSIKVLGLVVSGSQPRLPRNYRNRVRLFSHLLGYGSLGESESRRALGHVAYANMVEKNMNSAG